jgi:hypothetical protein
MNTPVTSPSAQSVFAAPELALGSVAAQGDVPSPERRRSAPVFGRRVVKPSLPGVRAIKSAPRPTASTPFSVAVTFRSLWDAPRKKGDEIRSLFE